MEPGSMWNIMIGGDDPLCGSSPKYCGYHPCLFADRHWGGIMKRAIKVWEVTIKYPVSFSMTHPPTTC